MPVSGSNSLTLVRDRTGRDDAPTRSSVGCGGPPAAAPVGHVGDGSVGVPIGAVDAVGGEPGDGPEDEVAGVRECRERLPGDGLDAAGDP